MTSKKIKIGAIIVTLTFIAAILTSILTEQNDVRFLLDMDKSTLKIKTDSGWVTGGIESGSYYKGSKKIAMNKSLSYLGFWNISGYVRNTRHAEYVDGSTLDDLWLYDAASNNKENVPIYHHTDGYANGSLIYQYVVKSLPYNGPTKTLTGTKFVANNVQVTWNESYYYAKITSAGTLTIKWKVKGNFHLENKLSDPVVTNSSITIVDDATVGTIAWTTTGYANLSDDVYATASGLGCASTAKENSIKIVKGGAIGGTEKSTGATLPTSDTYVTYGSSSDLWGLTWTASDINSVDFGVVYSAKGSNVPTFTSHYLKATNFNFSIPAGAVINGITVEIEQKRSGSGASCP